MADGLSVGNLSLSGGVTRLTGTSSKLDTEAIVAAAYAAKRQPAVRLEQRISRNDAKVAALGELQTLLGAVKDAVAGLRNPPGLLGVNENVFERKQAFLTGGASGIAPAELVGVSLENAAAAGQLHARGRAPGDRAQAGGTAAGRRRPDPGRRLERRGRRSPAHWRSGWPAAPRPRVAVERHHERAGSAGRDQRGQRADRGRRQRASRCPAGEQRLVLTAQETGKAIELADAGGDSVTARLAASDIQAAQTARILVDGVAVERAGNRIDDVMPGVTSISTAPARVPWSASRWSRRWPRPRSRSPASSPPTTALRDFVAAQGSVGAGGELGEGAVLFGDGTLRVGGPDAERHGRQRHARAWTPGVLRTLRDVGITLEAGGRLQDRRRARSTRGC